MIPRFNPSEWHKYLKKYEPNHICAVPSYIAALMDDSKVGDMQMPYLSTVGMGGEGMNVPLERRLNQFLCDHHSPAKILKGYGMTEVCGTATVEYSNANKEGSVGIPFINNNVMIYDNQNHTELRYCQVGEVCMQCLSQMSGYKNNAKETMQLLRKHSDGSIWLHTGDLGYVDEDGFLFIEGRIKRLLLTVTDGVVYKVVPSQIEDVINDNAEVLESCVVSMKLDNDMALRAFIVPMDYDTVDKYDLVNRLMNQCNERLSYYQIPRKMDIVESLPRNAAGKVDYQKLERVKL